MNTKSLIASELSIEEVSIELTNLNNQIRELQKQKEIIRQKCSHKYKDGSKATYPVGGGDSWCRTCETQIE